MKKLLILTILGTGVLGSVPTDDHNQPTLPGIQHLSAEQLAFVMPHHRPENQQAFVMPHHRPENGQAFVMPHHRPETQQAAVLHRSVEVAG